MKTIILLKNNKDDIKKTISIDYLFDSTNSNIDRIKLNKNKNDINFLVNHYDDNSNLNIICLEYNINNSVNNGNATDLYTYTEKDDTLNLINYSSNSTITFTDINFIDEYKYMIGMYKSPIFVDNVMLDTESGVTSILTKSDTNMLWNKKIKHTSSPESSTGPIISELVIDDNNNIYLFGLLTNSINTIDVSNMDINEIINPIINKKSSENIIIITKTNDDGVVIWRKQIIGNSDSLFLNQKISYNDDLIISFNFSNNIIINGKTYSTQSNQIINSIIAKIDTDGNFIWIKHLESEKYITNIDFSVDNDYIYCLGNFKGEAILDNIKLFQGDLESGYIIKIRKNDGLILNNINIYSDDLLLNSIRNDNDNIFISGVWSGNIYFNGNIKNSIVSDFFITNIKKKEF